VSENASSRTTLVLGVGNPLMGDEGFGNHVIRRLREMRLPSHVRVEEGGVGGFNLLGSVEGVKQLLVVDVMMMGLPPGELRLLKPGPELREPGKRIISFHQVGVMELVSMWRLLGYEPEIQFLLAQPQKIEWSTELSPPLELAAKRAAEMIPRLCQESFEKGTEEICLR
jgi:hydrogenase maturation protease